MSAVIHINKQMFTSDAFSRKSAAKWSIRGDQHQPRQGNKSCPYEALITEPYSIS